MPKFHMDEVYSKQDNHPLLINFQNAYITENFKNKQCSLFENEKSGIKTVSIELNDVLYAGEEVTPELGKTFVLAKNKTTGKVRLIEVGVADLKPAINAENEISKTLETSSLELSRKFGSKKQKKQMEHREKLKVNVQTVKEQMQNVTENVAEEKLDLSVYNKSDSDDFYIPPINRSADKVEDVYDMSKIFSNEEFDKISSELEGKDVTSDMLPFIKEIVSRSTLSNKHTVLAVYANALFKLHSTMVKEIVKKTFVACIHSETLNSRILTEFMSTTNGKRMRPQPYKDKSFCYAAVLILLINNFKIEVDGLCNDIKITKNTVAQKMRAIGACVAGVGTKKFVQLKLPLASSNCFRRKSAKF